LNSVERFPRPVYYVLLGIILYIFSNSYKIIYYIYYKKQPDYSNLMGNDLDMLLGIKLGIILIVFGVSAYSLQLLNEYDVKISKDSAKSIVWILFISITIIILLI